MGYNEQGAPRTRRHYEGVDWELLLLSITVRTNIATCHGRCGTGGWALSAVNGMPGRSL